MLFQQHQFVEAPPDDPDHYYLMDVTTGEPIARIEVKELASAINPHWSGTCAK